MDDKPLTLALPTEQYWTMVNVALRFLAKEGELPTSSYPWMTRNLLHAAWEITVGPGAPTLQQQGDQHRTEDAFKTELGELSMQIQLCREAIRMALTNIAAVQQMLHVMGEQIGVEFPE